MKKVIIYGLGVSGQAMYELLGDECEILLYRDGEACPNGRKEKKFLGKGESIPDDTDALLLSPSVPLNRRWSKPCKEKNIPVMGELELGYIRSKCRVVAVTGNKRKDDYGESNQSHTAQCGQVVLRAGQHRRSVLFDVRKTRRGGYSRP